MRVKYGDREYEAVTPDGKGMSLADLAALQRETGWKLGELQEMGQLELVGAQMLVFFTFRANGQKISFAKAGDLLDDVEFVADPGDDVAAAEAEEDPMSAPTGSGRGDDDEDAVVVAV